ncbi:MAG: hypothetical protein WA993_00200 [Candidatus Binatus sp.]
MASLSQIKDLREAFGDRDHYLGRAFLSALPPPPKKVELRNGSIVWQEKWGERDEALRADKGKPPGRELLENFLRLENASDREVRNFVSKWGPLMVCERHWLPAPHVPYFAGRCSKCRSATSDPQCNGWPRMETFGIKNGVMDRVFDPPDAYFSYARVARRLLEIAKAIRAKRPLGNADWDLQGGKIPFVIPTGAITGLSDVERLAWYLDCWLLHADVRPRVVSRHGRLTVEFEGSRVFGAIGFELIATITGSTELAVCSECSRPFLSRKHVREGKRRYCADCGHPAAVRKAVARYYEKHREQVLKRRKLRRAEARRKSRWKQ